MKETKEMENRSVLYVLIHDQRTKWSYEKDLKDYLESLG